jgi:hypothetical protein
MLDTRLISFLLGERIPSLTNRHLEGLCPVTSCHPAVDKCIEHDYTLARHFNASKRGRRRDLSSPTCGFLSRGYGRLDPLPVLHEYGLTLPPVQRYKRPYLQGLPARFCRPCCVKRGSAACESGGTGRRARLRISWATVGVQVPPLAPFFQTYSNECLKLVSPEVSARYANGSD